MALWMSLEHKTGMQPTAKRLLTAGTSPLMFCSVTMKRRASTVSDTGPGRTLTMAVTSFLTASTLGNLTGTTPNPHQHK